MELAEECNTFSSTSGSKLPMKRLAPTSRVSLSWDALFTLIALPNSLIMLRILMAYVMIHIVVS